MTNKETKNTDIQMNKKNRLENTQRGGNLTQHPFVHTVFPKSSDPSYVVSYYIKWVTTSWTHNIKGRL